VKDAKLAPLGLYGLRHTWGTAAYEAGEPLRAISEHLGHADTAITNGVYVHTVRGVQDATALRVAELFASKRARRPGMRGRQTGGRNPVWTVETTRATGRASERKWCLCREKKMVGVARFELATPSPPDALRG